jgi:hypothetical protein
MLEKIWWIVKLLIPPTDGNEAHMLRYHITQSVSHICIWIVAGIAAVWLFGKIPFVPQVAWASDIKTISDNQVAMQKDSKHVNDVLEKIELLNVRSNISEQVKDVCLAERNKNQSDLDEANKTLNDLTDDFYKLTGRVFVPPSCDTVLVTP